MNFKIFNFFRQTNTANYTHDELSPPVSFRIPNKTLEQLDKLAGLYGRSRNQQLTMLLKYGLDRDTALLEELQKLNHDHFMLLQRFHYCLNAIEINFGVDAAKLSVIAERIGHSDVNKVANWLIGEETPSFTEIEGFAELFNIDAEWLKHGGEGFTPWRVTTQSWVRNPSEFIQLLAAQRKSKAIKRLAMVRNDYGSVAVVLVYDNNLTHTINFYNLRLKDQNSVGGSGFSDLVSLAFICSLFHQNKHTLDIERVFHITGYSIPDADFEKLITGEANPNELFLKGFKGRCHWDETIWDITDINNMSDKSMWSGAKALFEAIATSESFTRLVSDFEIDKFSSKTDYQQALVNYHTQISS